MVKTTKKLISVLLALMMLATVIPMSAFTVGAEATLDLESVLSEVVESNESDTISDVDLVDVVRVNKSVADTANASSGEDVVYSVAAINSFYSSEAVTVSDEPSISDYDTFIAYLGFLEEIAYVYKLEQNPNADPLNVAIKYIRTGVDRYNTGSWGIMAGYEDKNFANFVQQVQDANNADIPEEEWIYVTSLKNINNFYLPNGDYVDMGHIFGTMDITYNNYGSINHADVGGWAGDIVDLLSYVDSISLTGTVEEMAAEIIEKYLGSAGSAAQSFGSTDLLGDLDAFYIMNELDVANYACGNLTALMTEYFNGDLDEVDRADYFIKNRMDSITLRSSLREKVYNAYMNNNVIATLEGTREFVNKDLTDLRKASCYAFADYICKLAGDYVESVENDYYEVAATEHSTLAPGITQEIKQSLTADGKSMVYYIATGDLTRDDVNLYANYNDNDPSKGWEMQRVLDQALAAQDKYGNPESDKYIENYNVIVATNGSGYNMSTGEPSGLLVMGGVEYHAINSSGFVGVLKNGKPVIGTTEEYKTIYKDQVAEGIAVFGYTLVKDGKLVNNAGNTRASRTAIGITKTGKIVMMVLDGRQEPFSCGGTINEIAQIMLDAGCVDAVNLDGGGSTTYVAKQEGADELAVVSRPSDGYARSVSTSFMLVSTAPSSTAFDHAVIESEADYLTVGSSLNVTAKGVSATGNSAVLPEGTHWEISDSSIATIDENGKITALQNGAVDVYLMLGDERLAFKTIEILVPDTVFFTKTEMNAVYGSRLELPVKATYMEKPVIINPADVVLAVDENAGTFDGFTFIGDETVGVKVANITISLPSNPERVFTLAVSLFKQGEAAFDFELATGGDRQLAWYREISNSTTIDNKTYYALDANEEMVTSYTVAIDMSAIETPEKLEELTYMLPGADAQGVTAWHFLCQLAERVSPLTTIITTINFDKNFDVDYSEIKLLNEYFLLTDVQFSDETNALTLTLKWKDQTAAIDAENANPICILSGIKLTPKEDAAWDADSRINVCHTGDVEYDIYLRASALYTFAQKPENQEKYDLYDYVNPDDPEDKGGHLRDIYKTFEDTYTLVAALKNGWEAVDGGYVYYEEGQKLVGLHIIDGAYYMFDENGLNVGKTKYTGLFFDEEVNAYRYAKLGTIMGGWQTIGDDWYYFYEDTKVAQTGIGYHFSGVKYVFDKTGKLTSGVWIENANGRRYFYGPSWYAQRWAQIDGESYYFNKSGYCVTGNHVVDDGTLIHFIACVFGSDGKLLYYPTNTGIFKAEEGLYYLVDGVVQVDLGLIKIQVDGKTQYIYVSTTGKLAVGKCTVWVNNNLVPYASVQTFDENGFMEYDDTIKNGIVNENGTLYYYIDNVMQVNLGLVLIEVDGVEKYIYVRTAGQLAVGEYTVWLNHDIVPYASVQTFDANGFMVIGDDFHTHKFGAWIVDDAATCEEDGLRHKECSICGSKLREALGALGHNYATKVVDPTCTTQGYTSHTCANCGDSYNTDYVDILGHSYSAVVTAPTCTEKGYTTHTCANCGDSYVDTYTDAAGHSYGDWIVETDATCTDKGTQYHVCGVCGATESESIPAKGHDYAAVVTEPTCVSQGYTTHTCTACGDSYKDTYVSAKGHSYSKDWTVDVEATDLKAGQKSHHCEVCGAKTDITEIPAKYAFSTDNAEDGIIISGNKAEISGAFVVPETLDGTKVAAIGDNAFAEQNLMTVIGIPSSVKSISSTAFYGCVSLKAINFNGTIAQWKEINVGANAIPAGVRINYLGETIGDIDRDGQVAATDLTYVIQQILVGGELTETDEYIYDANADGLVNLVDLVRLKKYLAGKSDILGDETAYATVFAAEVVAYEDRKDN